MTPQSPGATIPGGQPQARAGQPSRRRPETPAERHARRKAWGAKYGPLMRSIIVPAIREMDARR